MPRADWNTPIGRIVEVKELLPGDPALPRRTGSGRLWPREAGALIATARLNTAVREGKDALSNIAFFGAEAAFSIGYRAVKSRQRGAVRELLDVDLYEVSPVLFGAHPDARVYSGKTGRPAGLEVKAVPMGVSVPHSGHKRWAIRCGSCDSPIALATKPLRAGAGVLCAQCVAEASQMLDDPFDYAPDDQAEALDTDDGPDFGEFDDQYNDDRAPRITAEQAYADAQRDETEHDVDADADADADADGTLGRARSDRDRWRP